MGASMVDASTPPACYINVFPVEGEEFSIHLEYPSLASSVEGTIASEVVHAPPDESTSEPQTLSVSTVFNPEILPTYPDIVFASLDCVLFYVDMKVVAKASPRAFQSAIIGAPRYKRLPGSMRIVFLQEMSPVLNIILHILYDMSCASYSPVFETLVDAVNHMPRYDISPTTHIAPFSHIFTTLQAFAPMYPLELYTLAGHHRLHDIAVIASSHLLSCSLASISDETAQKMGSLYLKRLVSLHLNRFHSLREMLSCPPPPHPPTRECALSDQAGLSRAWALASAYLAWDARADLSTHNIRRVFDPLIEELSCQLCRECMEAKLEDVVMKWASVKHTI